MKYTISFLVSLVVTLSLVVIVDNVAGGSYKKYYVVAKDNKNPKVKNKRLEDLVQHLGGPIKRSKHTMLFSLSEDDIKNKGIPEGVIIEELKRFHTPTPKFFTGCTQKPEPPPTLPPNPTNQIIDWGIKRVEADVAQKTEDAHNVKVCVLDTGIDLTHNDLKFLQGSNFTSWNDLDFQDRYGHGSHTAGLVAAINNSYGVLGASQAKLIIGKVLDDTGSGYNSWIADGIDYCVDSGSHIISMSLGGPDPSSVIENSLYRATQLGIWVFAAAGNDSSNQVGYPAGYVMNNLFSISAIDQNDELAWFSNYGKVEYTCPGVEILSTVPWNSYDRYSGTSMATPICAGVAAIFRARDKPLKARELGDHEKFGSGILNAMDAL